MGFDKTVLAHHRDGAAKLEAVSKATSIDGNARVWALIMAKCWGKKLQGDKDMMRKILETRRSEREKQTHTREMLLRNVRPILNGHSLATFCSSF